MKREPVLWVNLVQTVIRTGILAAISLGFWELTQEQIEALLLFVAALLALLDLVGTWFVRSRVSPVAKPQPATWVHPQSGGSQ